MSKKIAHIASNSTFIIGLIQFIKENFNSEEHNFFLTVGDSKDTATIKGYKNVALSSSSTSGKFSHYLEIVYAMYDADKIILHGLFNIRLVIILFANPWLLKKCYWIIWGGDLYTYQLNERTWKWKVKEFIRRPVIKNMGHLVTYIPGDVELARKWYSAKGKYHECLMYLSNTYKALDVPSTQTDTINIQIGNSADSSNNHIEVLEKLLPFKDENIKLYAPLSYGDKSNAKKVIAKGKELFGDKFIALTDFVPFEEYLQFLGSIDIAIFNHRRQQAMGNTITLLGLGKTVFIRSDTTQWQFFKEKNIKVYDSIKLESLDKKEHLDNILKVKDYFSEETLKKQLKELF